MPNQNLPVKQLLKMPSIEARFNQVLDKRAPQFMSSLASAVATNSELQEADQMSVISSAMVVATLDLPINPSLGFAYIVPFNEKNRQTGKWSKRAQPQIGYRGYIQLAQRSGDYKALNALPVYEDEFGGWNPLTEELKYVPNFHDRDEKEKPVGYAAYFTLLNGFKKTVYWTYQQVDNHRKRFSQSGGKGKNEPKGVWATNYEAMALKTILKSLLTKWGPMTTDMQTAAINDDQPVQNDDAPAAEQVKDVTPENSINAVMDRVGEPDAPKQASNDQPPLPEEPPYDQPTLDEATDDAN